MEKGNPLTVAVVGCGTVAGYGHLPAVTARPDFTIAAYVDLNISRAEAFARRFGPKRVFNDYREVLDLDDVDIVAVLTPPTEHFTIIKDALQAGKHVFTEKPMTADVKSADELVQLASRSDRKLFVGYLLRHTGVYQRMADEIHAGRIGRPMVFRMISFEHYPPDNRTLWDRALNSFILDTSPGFDCGCHYADLMRWFSAAEAIRVRGIGARVHPDVPQGYFDWEAYHIEFDDGSRGFYEVGWGSSFPEDQCVKEAIGPAGWLAVRMAATEEGKESGAELVFGRPEGTEEIVARSQWKGFEGEWAAFARMIHDDLDPLPGLNDAVASLRIVEAGHQSALTGTVIDLRKR